MSEERMTRRERRERKAEQLEIWADGREGKAAAAFERSSEIAARIPFGQPILVGHHSERGHRADLARIDSAMRQSVENDAKAREMRERAEGIRRQNARAVFSDDVDALERLAAKVAALEARRDRIKAYNKSCRPGGDHGDFSLLSNAEAADVAASIRHTPFQCKNGRAPGWMLSNLGSEIRRNRQRLEELGRPGSGRPLVAKYAGVCRSCGAGIDVGESCTYYRRSRELECAGCAS